MRRADGRNIIEGVSIRRQKQVVAIVDVHAKALVMVGATTPARRPGCFMDEDARVCCGKMYSCGEARQARANDVNVARAHRSRVPSRVSKSLILLRLMGVRGGAKPRSIRACSRFS